METRAELVKELRAAGPVGLSLETLQSEGICSIEACRANLVVAGYDVVVTGTGGGQEVGDAKRTWGRLSRPAKGLAPVIRPYAGDLLR